MSKLAEAHCHNQIQSRLLISVTSTSSTVMPGVSNSNVSDAKMNERDGHYQMGLLWKDVNPVLP